MTQITVARDEHTTGAQIEAYLHRYGIPMHGRRITSQAIIFSVPSQQAGWAQTLLARMGTARQPTAWKDKR